MCSEEVPHPGDQRLADHEAGHFAVFEWSSEIPTGKEEPLFVFGKFIVTINREGRQWGFNDFSECFQRLKPEIHALHMVGGIAAEALGMHLDKIGKHDVGITTSELELVLGDLVGVAMELARAGGREDIKALKKEIDPNPDLPSIIAATLLFMRGQWPRVLRMSKALLAHRVITHETYASLVLGKTNRSED